jgi:serine/threonine protein kinase|tara:strand:- start:10689 stop:11279 length:591 start_codon:yes stop_codon:yes gene_type:complete
VRNLSQTERQEAVNEIRLLASVQQNAAISGFHEAFIDGNRLCIVMEYAPFGDLSRALRKRQAQKKLLPEDLIWSYFIQITRGLQALHAQKILHRDVKTANVLRMSGEIVKLGDLGIAKLMKGAMTHTQIGTYFPITTFRLPDCPYSYQKGLLPLSVCPYITIYKTDIFYHNQERRTTCPPRCGATGRTRSTAMCGR